MAYVCHSLQRDSGIRRRRWRLAVIGLCNNDVISLRSLRCVRCVWATLWNCATYDRLLSFHSCLAETLLYQCPSTSHFFVDTFCGLALVENCFLPRELLRIYFGRSWMTTWAKKNSPVSKNVTTASLAQSLFRKSQLNQLSRNLKRNLLMMQTYSWGHFILPLAIHVGALNALAIACLCHISACC